MKIKTHISFYLLIFAILFALISPFLLAEGMFLDGISYATISNNLANDLGSFWEPFLTEILYPEFYEHPPLAFGLQSLWFRVFGDSIWVEKFYSLFTFILVGIGITKIWKHFTNDIKFAWIPLLFWVIIPSVTWAVSSNILENTMSIFVTFSVFYYLKSREKNSIFLFFISGFLLSLSFLTKGFTGLYVLSAPFFMWIIFKKEGFKKMVLHSFLYGIFTILPLGILFLLIPESFENISRYFQKQIIGSLQNTEPTVVTRFQIIIDFFSAILPILILGILLFVIGFYKKIDAKIYSKHKQLSLLFIGITLAGVIPIMVSMKQSGFYILTVYPFFSIGVGLIFYPLLKKWVEAINTNSLKFKIWNLFSVLAFSVSLFLVFSNFNKSTRDAEIIKASLLIKNKIEGEKIIDISPSLEENWSLHGYFMRNSSISLSSTKKLVYLYYLTNKKDKQTVDLEFYKQIPMDLENYFLFKKIESKKP